MLHKLKHRLVLLYTISTGTILIVSMIIVYRLNLVQIQKQTMENFLLNADAIISQLESKQAMNLSNLAVLETSKHMIIYIEDNGTPISFQGAYQSKTDRNILIQRVQDEAILEGINVHNVSNVRYLERSSIIPIRGDSKDNYYGYVVLLPNGDTYLSLTMLCSMTEALASSNTNLFAYIAITILGVLCFFLLSFFLISKVLHPVQENQRRQVEFVASASHELRSPLAYIQTATSELSTDCLPNLSGSSQDTLSDYIRNTQEECSRMSQLIEDMLLLASADRKTWSLHMSSTNIDTYFINSYDTLSYLCEQKQHHLSLELPDELLGDMVLDGQRIYQILQILIHNACCYTPSDSGILLKPYCEKKSLYVEVIDHGPGVPDDEKERIFERYYRSDPSRTETNHFGLGLNIALELAHLHHGTLTLRDTPGGGCTFVLTLPVVR